MPEPTDPSSRSDGPPRHWLDYIKGRAPHLLTVADDFVESWWWHDSVPEPRVVPMASRQSEHVLEARITAPPDGRGPPHRAGATRKDRDAAPALPPASDGLVTDRAPERSTVPAQPRARVHVSAPGVSRVMPETPGRRESARTAPREPPARRTASRTPLAARTTFDVAAPRASQTAASPVRVRRPEREPQTSEPAHQAAARQRVVPPTGRPPELVLSHPADEPLRDEWPRLPVERVTPRAPASSVGGADGERLGTPVEHQRAVVIEARDPWPLLPVVERAEAEPWRDLERERVRDDRIAREQASR